MNKRIISAILVVTFLNLFGCYSMQKITREELIEANNKNDIIITTTNGDSYLLENLNHPIVNDTIYANGLIKTELKNDFDRSFSGKIAMSDVIQVESDKIDWLPTSFVIFGVLLITSLIALLFIYSGSGDWMD